MDVWWNIKTKMRDGISLSSDIYFPDNIEASTMGFPAIYSSTPYGTKSEDQIQIAQLLTAQGYILVAQDVRGSARAMS